MRDINKTLGTNIHDDLRFVEVITKENGEDVTTLTKVQKNRLHGAGVRPDDGNTHANGGRQGAIRKCN